ncbi:MAG: poly-A polymerase, partial [Leptospiraceae bacterium]|nr:poly-A polymerase [Leptospiraceae bacterium]
MKYENLINPDLIPTKIKEDFQFIQNKIQEANGEAYLVGGAVRDLVMEKSPHEYDITTSLPPETIQKIFNKVKETGIQHGTVLVLLKNENYEFTTYRTEQGYSDGRRPDEVKYSTSLEEDLMRRDFTMNALAMNLEDYSVLDFHNGINDIKNKTIRTIGNPIERFSEDGLRPIRAIRFLSSLEFRIEENTYKAIHETKEITSKISKERFHDEILKILKNNSPYLSIKELFNNKIFSLFVDNVNEDYNIENLKIIDKLIKSPVGLRLSFILKILLEGKENYSEEGEKILKELKFSRENIKDTLFFLSFINE